MKIPHNVFLLVFLIFGNSLFAQSKWVDIGPTGGMVNSIKCFPNKNEILLSGLHIGGFYRSTNEGESWENIFIDPVYDIAITEDSIAYVASKIGLFVSTDYGVNWNRILQTSTRQVVSHIKGIVVADTISNSQSPSSELIISYNYGLKWEKWKGTDRKSYSILSDGEKRGSLIFHISGTVFRSELTQLYKTEWTNWEKWINLETVINTPGVDPPYIVLLTPSKGDSTIYIYSQAYDHHPGGYQPGGIFESTDLGATWKYLNYTSTAYLAKIDDQLIIGSDKGEIIIFDKKTLQSKKLFTAGGKITGIIDEDWKNQKLIISTNGGIFKTTDGGVSWSFICKGIQHPTITAFQIIPINNTNERIVAYAYNNGICCSDDKGKSWQLKQIPYKVFPGMIKKSFTNSKYLLAGGNYIFMSSDGGESWGTTNVSGVPYYGGGETISITATTFNQNGFSAIYNAHSKDDFRGNFYLSSEWVNGTTFKWNVPALSTKKSKLWFDKKQNYLWGSIRPGYDYKCVPTIVAEDSLGEQKFQIQIPDSSAADLFLVDGDKVFIFNSRNKKLWTSYDNGTNWNSVKVDIKNAANSYLDFGIPNISFGEIKYDSQQQWLFLLFPNNGIIASKDDGKSLSPFNNGLRSLAVYQLEFSSTNPNVCYVATNDGLYMIDVASDVADIPAQIPAIHKLLQNYPNPFNPETTIEYSIPTEAHRGEFIQRVTLKVYDVLGRYITTLVNEEKSAGYYKATFNGINLPSGVYFYQLKTGNFIETKKLVLLK
ncbi:MAG: T9SS type A sorting domain-containing protein [Ignavibacteria bacterium]|nr:T9SS type A sorting domain-containing protein [Ignavibacteria bacterium]